MNALDISIPGLLDCIAHHGLAAAWQRLKIGWHAWRRLLELRPELAAEVDEAERYHLERLSHRALAGLDRAANPLQLNKAKLRLDHTRWLLERRAPSRYSSRVQLDLNVSFDLRVAVDEARARVEAITVEAVPVGSARRLIG